jgi:hypothetical protein
MLRVGSRLKLACFNFRVDGDLKRAFLEVAEREDRPAGSILESIRICGAFTARRLG